MALHNKWYPAAEDTIIPWNATYSFPTEANKAEKSTPRIQPKTGSSFGPGELFRIEFPASGYINPLNTVLVFDVTLTGFTANTGSIIRFQNNIASIFERITLYYGSNVIEDMRGYNIIVRGLTEWTATNQMVHDNSSICEGIGGVVVGSDGGGGAQGLVNLRNAYIQGYDGSSATDANFSAGDGFGGVPNAQLNGTSTTSDVYSTRRYAINLALGLFTQDKLIPVKYMAAQLGIEFTLANASSCIFAQLGGGTATLTPSFRIANIAMLPEVLQFDSSYDKEFLKGLEGDGVPIKFSSWHRFTFPTAGSSVANLIVQEKSRSVKAIFMVQRRAPESIYTDSGAFFYDSSTYDSSNGNSLVDYQYRIGDRYYPGRPVQFTGIGGSISNGGAEGYMELQKAMNTMGDYRLSPPVNSNRWAMPPSTATITPTGNPTASALNEFDYCCNVVGWTHGNPIYSLVQSAAAATGNSFCGNLGSNCFTMAMNLETSNGVEISGLNAEQQSDISLIANWSAGQNSNFVFEVFTYYDAMLILRSGNDMDLIQ